MICVAIFEPDTSRMADIRKWLTKYTVQNNCELELLRFEERNPIEKVEKYAKAIQIALISLDNVRGEEIGKALYRENQDCRICYYREMPCDLQPLLSSRPIEFYLWKDGEEMFLQKFGQIYEEVTNSQTLFCYETKSRSYLIPKQNILYFQSDLRYVNIRLLQGESPRILSKLSDIEKLAGSTFVRIHKSYLVNLKYVLWLDKKSHMVQMADGEQLPISDAQYDMACKRISGR